MVFGAEYLMMLQAFCFRKTFECRSWCDVVYLGFQIVQVFATYLAHQSITFNKDPR